jgi:phospholipid/cholesterol/gamma-HCH transport system substrate-binding protein
VLVDHHMNLENILHLAPTAIANFMNDYNPDTGTIDGGFGLMNFANPTSHGGMLVPLPIPGCSQVASSENVTAAETGKLCSLFLGPGLRLLNFNSSPIPINPFLAKSANPENIIYTEQRLAPGGEGPKPGAPEIPPAISAYGGLDGDSVVPGPAPSVPLGRIPGAAMPLPPAPTVPMESPPPPPPPPLPAEGPRP